MTWLLRQDTHSWRCYRNKVYYYYFYFYFIYNFRYRAMCIICVFHIHCTSCLPFFSLFYLFSEEMHTLWLCATDIKTQRQAQPCNTSVWCKPILGKVRRHKLAGFHQTTLVSAKELWTWKRPQLRNTSVWCTVGRCTVFDFHQTAPVSATNLA